MVVSLLYTALFVLMLQPAAAPPAAAPATQPAAGPVEDFTAGPLRVELLGLVENRIRMLQDVPNSPRQSDLRMQFRVRGEGLDRMVRSGSIIFSEAVDDTGRSLLRADHYTAEERAASRLVTLPPERLKTAGFTPPTTKIDLPQRTARKIARLRGELKVFLADAHESVTIINPRQFTGRLIEHPRLKELGVEISIPAAGQFAEPLGERALPLVYGAKRENIRRISWFDEAMKPIRARETERPMQSGGMATVVQADPHPLGENTQMVIEVYAAVEQRAIPITIDDLELP